MVAVGTLKTTGSSRIGFRRSSVFMRLLVRLRLFGMHKSECLYDYRCPTELDMPRIVER